MECVIPYSLARLQYQKRLPHDRELEVPGHLHQLCRHAQVERVPRSLQLHKSQESPQVVETSVHMKEWATDCEVPAAALTRLSLLGLPDDQWNDGWIMAISNQNHCLAQQHWSEWTQILADSGAAERVFSEHHFSGAPIRPASRVVMRTADGTKVVTDYVKRVRLRTESDEKVLIDLRSANVTHPILSVSGMSNKGNSRQFWVTIAGYLETGSKRLELTCRGPHEGMMNRLRSEGFFYEA